VSLLRTHQYNDHMVWKPNLHPKYPKGTPGGKGGQFMPVGSPHWNAAVKAQVAAHAAKQAAPPAPKKAAVKKAAPSVPTPVKAAKAAAKKAAPKAPVVPKAAKATPVPKAPKAAKKTAKAPVQHPFALALPASSTDAQLDKRAARVERVVNRGTASDVTHKPNGRWSTSRAALHQQIVSELWRAAAGVPAGRQAVFTGGPSGAGKSTALALQHQPGQYLILDPDLAKEALARHGAIPGVPGHADLSPMERSTLVHAESLHITEMLAQRAYKAGTNVVWDGTMVNNGLVSMRAGDLRRHGYSVEGLFVDAPLATTKVRTAARYRQAQRDFEVGKGHGGRHVPDWVVQTTQSARSGFDALRRSGAFDSWTAYDNGGSAPRLTGQG
jgi:predicted kinase